MGWSSADDRVAVRLVGGLAETAGVRTRGATRISPAPAARIAIWI